MVGLQQRVASTEAALAQEQQASTAAQAENAGLRSELLTVQSELSQVSDALSAERVDGELLGLGVKAAV